MNLPYTMRLLCLSAACLYLLHAALSLIVGLLAPAAVRRAGRMGARDAATFLLALRVLPTIMAFLIVTVLCVPSYLSLEQQASVERVGPACLACALAALVTWAVAAARGVRAVCWSIRYVKRVGSTGTNLRVTGEDFQVHVAERGSPPLALVGLVRGRLVVSAAVIRALPAGQLCAAFRHERAHQLSWDNLKRLLIVATPDLFPGLRVLRGLEHGWARYSEWAADDRAAGGDAQRSLLLADAIVRVARMSSETNPAWPGVCLVADGEDLSERVDRLLTHTVQGTPRYRWDTAGIFLFATALTAGMVEPSILGAVHELLEHLVR